MIREFLSKLFKKSEPKFKVGEKVLFGMYPEIISSVIRSNGEYLYSYKTLAGSESGYWEERRVSRFTEKTND